MDEQDGFDINEINEVLQEYEDYAEEMGDIEDILAEFNEEQKEKLKESVEKVSSSGLIESDEVRSRMRALDSVGKDVDEELERLIRDDAAGERKLEEMEDVAIDFVNDPTVYDNTDWAAYENQQNEEKPPFYLRNKAVAALFERLAALPNLVLYILIGILAVTFVTLVIIMVLVITQNQAETAAEEESLKITQAPVIANSANYIYIDAVSELNGSKLTLVKMIYDRIATVFYFDKNIDVMRYDVTLMDDADNMYAMDLSFYPFDADTEDGRTIMRFKPFKAGVHSFVLGIMDTFTGSKAEYEFIIENESMPPAKYYYLGEDFLTNFPDVTAKIESAMFSSSGTILNFSFSWASDNESVVFGTPQGESSGGSERVPISMYQASTVMPRKAKPNLYYFEEFNTVIGRMDFAPVRNLTGKVRVTFQDLLKQYRIDREIPVADIWLKKEDSSVVIDMGDDYELHVDRLIYQAGMYILVVHAVDNSLIAKSGEAYNTDEFSRAEVVLDATLVAVAPSGMEISLGGKVNSRQAGSDILFSPSAAKEFLAGADPENFRLNIKSASIRIGDVTTVVDLDQSALEPDDTLSRVESQIIGHFENRLAYKSGEDVGVTGFIDTMQNSELLARHYAPVDYTGKASYSAQVVSHKITDDNSIIAVVQETWKDEKNGAEIFFNATHSVICKFDGGQLIIVSDKIHI